MEILQEDNIFNNADLCKKIKQERDFLYNQGLVDYDILDIPQKILYILNDDKTVTGFMTYCHYNNAMWLIFCWVDPFCRVRNIASKMLNRLREVARGYGKDCKIRTQTHVKNVNTQAVLLKRDFKPIHCVYEL